MSWFEDREADQRWMQGKHGERMARELENLSSSRVLLEPGQHNHLDMRPEPLVSFFGNDDGVPVADSLEDFASTLPKPAVPSEACDAPDNCADVVLPTFFENDEAVSKQDKIDGNFDFYAYLQQ